MTYTTKTRAVFRAAAEHRCQVQKHAESGVTHSRTGSSVDAVMTGRVRSRPGRDPEDYRLTQVFGIYLAIGPGIYMFLSVTTQMPKRKREEIQCTTIRAKSARHPICCTALSCLLSTQHPPHNPSPGLARPCQPHAVQTIHPAVLSYP